MQLHVCERVRWRKRQKVRVLRNSKAVYLDTQSQQEEEVRGLDAAHFSSCVI